MRAAAAVVAGDGDVVAAASLGNKIAWYETEPGTEINEDEIR